MGWLPATDAPLISPHGGTVSNAFDIHLTTSVGVIYFTADGNDPRLLGGALAPSASQFTRSLRLDNDANITSYFPVSPSPS